MTAPRGPWFCAPGRDRLFGEPHCQAAALAQGSIIFRPVSYPILLLGDVMTAIGIGLEWHSEHPRRLSTGVASHLGLLGSLCRPRCFGTVQPRAATAKSRSRRSGPTSTLPGPRPQPD